MPRLQALSAESILWKVNSQLCIRLSTTDVPGVWMRWIGLPVSWCCARGGTPRLPRRPSQVHAVMNKAEDLDDVVRRQPVDHQVARTLNPILRLDQAPGQVQRKRAQPLHPRHRLGPGKVRGGADRSQGRQDQLVVAHSRVNAELLRAA